jgi:hypothetical protein
MMGFTYDRPQNKGRLGNAGGYEFSRNFLEIPNEQIRNPEKNVK